RAAPPRQARGVQQRPGLAIHERCPYRRAQARKRGHQHGRTRTGAGQHLCRALVAQRKVRRRVPEGLRQHGRAD
ncbi:hypothetical protein LTR94_036086, partial [Friedmanniomyces endolithicus]